MQVTGAASSSFWRPPHYTWTAGTLAFGSFTTQRCNLKNLFISRQHGNRSTRVHSIAPRHSCGRIHALRRVGSVQCMVDVWLHEAWCYSASCPSIIPEGLHKRKWLNVRKKIEQIVRCSQHGSLWQLEVFMHLDWFILIVIVVVHEGARLLSSMR